MPTTMEVIERVDRTAENAWTEEEKARWLFALEGKLFLQVAQGQGEPPPTRWPEDGEKPLLVPPPYDTLYDCYLLAMMDFHNREWDQYANTCAMFDTAVSEWAKQYRRGHMPLGAGYWKGL